MSSGRKGCLISSRGRITGKVSCYCCGGTDGPFWLWVDQEVSEARVVDEKCRPGLERSGGH